MPPSELQRLPSRLAPLSEALERIDAMARPVEAHEVDVAAAAGRVLAADGSVAQSLPPVAVALRDGWAVRSDVIADAGPYAPVALIPPPVFVEVGAPLPLETDAVLPHDALTRRGSIAEATASVVPGDGVLTAGAGVPRPGAEGGAGEVRRRAGGRLHATDVALLRAGGVPRVAVRASRLVIITANPFIDAIDDTVAPLLGRAIAGDGGAADIVRG